MTAFQVAAHFWTLRDDVVISDCDLGAFKYHPTKESDVLVGPYGPLKRTLCEARDQIWTPGNKRPVKLKDTLTELEQIFAHQILVHAEWSAAQHGSGFLVFNNGVLAQLTINLSTGDLHEILIDKSLDDKLLADVASAAISPEVVVLAHGIPYLTIIHTSQSLISSTPISLGQCTTAVHGIQLPGPGTRRQERKIILSPDSNNVCVWWEREGGELFAWSPVVKAEDRANILIYTTNSSELVACHFTEHNPISVEFSSRNANFLRVTELMSSAKGRTSVASTLYDIRKGLQQSQQRLLRVAAPPRCHCYSPDEQILLLGCVDAQIIAWRLNQDSFTSFKATFIPFHLTWHGSSAFFIAASERGQLQCWDRALNPLLLRFKSPTAQRDSSATLHLQQYLRHQASLVSMKWALEPSQDASQVNRGPAIPFKSSRGKSMRRARKKRSTLLKSKEIKAASEYLLICFERGPLLCLRFLAGCWPATCSLNALTLCSEYLNWHQFEPAAQLILSMNWTNVSSFQEEDVLLGCFTRVVNTLLQQPQSKAPITDKLLENIILHLIDTVRDDEALIGPVLDAARKSFRLLSMRNRLHSAAVYALKLEDADLLVELILLAQAARDQSLLQRANAALACVRESYSSGSSSSSGSSCSSYTTSGSSSRSHSSLSCSTCDEAHSDSLPSQLSNIRLNEDSGDQVHVISFGVV